MERMERLERSRRVERLEITCRSFAVRSGIRQEAADFTTLIQPKPGSRKGTLALLTEPAGDHPSLSVEACKLAQKIITDQYSADTSLSLTSGFLGALDAANSAVLRFNYASPQDEPGEEAGGPVAVRAGGSRARKFKVGLTAVMLRADGTGIYLAQRAPAQAYLRHNGMVSPVPETPGWHSQARITKNRPPLSLVRDEAEQEQNLFADPVSEEAAPDYTQENLLAPALGTDPGIESDLMYRRVEEGDMIVLVSSGLARLLDHSKAEELFSTGDADAVSEALFDLAMSNGTAQAHACILTLDGTALEPAPIETEWNEPPDEPLHVATVHDTSVVYRPQPLPQPLFEQSAGPPPEEPTQGRLAGLKDTLLAPKAWFDSRKHQSVVFAPSSVVDRSDENVPANEVDAPWTQEPLQMRKHVHVHLNRVTPPSVEHATERTGDAQQESQAQMLEHPESQTAQPEPYLHEPSVPAREALQRTVYSTGHKAPVLWAENEEATDAPFEGRHDTLPAAYDESEDGSRPTVFPWEKEPRPRPFQRSMNAPVQDMSARKDYPAPRLFNGPAGTPTPTPAVATARGRIRLYPGADAVKWLPGHIGKLGRSTVAWVGSTAHSMLPERRLFKPRQTLNRLQGSKGRTVSIRVLTGLAIVVVLGLLVWSVLRVVGNGKQSQVNTLLQQAKQEDLLANQPSTSSPEREKTLGLALQHAKQAVADDPQSSEAKLLVGKVQVELDKAQGITRLGQAALLFDLTQAGSTKPPAPSSKTTDPVAGTTQAPTDIIVMSNDAYVLDRGSGKVYKCGISARSCAPALSAGDTAGGQKVGRLVGMTMRVGNLVAVDDKLMSYVYSPDTSAWQAEQLGGADKLQKPVGIATYDGNLYLLGAKTGQISKYVAGKYGSQPDDWIKDQASSDQMKNPVAVAIDGAIYVLLNDGKILVMQGGKVVRTITPKAVSEAAPNAIFTGTDTRNLYTLEATNGAITQISKDGQTLGTFKAPASDSNLATLSGMTVDEGRGKIYMVSGQKVYEAVIPGSASQTLTTIPPLPIQPAARPTVEP